MNPLPPKIRHFRNLVGEHRIHRLLLQNLLPSPRMCAIIQQRRNNLTVLLRLCKAPGATSVERLALLLLRAGIQRLTIQVPVWIEAQFAVRGPLVHPREALLHLLARKHCDTVNAHRLEDMFEEVIIQLHPADTLDQLARPVDVDAVLPSLAGLVDQRL